MKGYYGKPGFGHWFRQPKRQHEKPQRFGPTKPTGKARVLTREQFEKAADMALERCFYPTRDRLFVLLSRYCAMRAKEIATLWFEDVTDAEGKFTDRIHISKRGAKYGKERTVRINQEIMDALEDYIRQAGITQGPIFWSHRGVPLTSNAVQKQLKAIYLACGFNGARSHSGRRSAITALARRIGTIGGSLEDVRLFAGHAHLQTTQDYIEPNPETAERIIDLL